MGERKMKREDRKGIEREKERILIPAMDRIIHNKQGFSEIQEKGMVAHQFWYNVCVVLELILNQVSQKSDACRLHEYMISLCLLIIK